MSENSSKSLSNLDEKEQKFYRALVSFLMDKCEAQGIVLTVIDGKDGSGCIVGVENPSLLPDVKMLLSAFLETLSEQVINPSAN
jgi:hypothetical protein